MITQEVNEEAIVEKRCFEDIPAMAPIAMRCETEGCQYATGEYEAVVAVELFKAHREDKHPRAVGGSG